MAPQCICDSWIVIIARPDALQYLQHDRQMRRVIYLFGFRRTYTALSMCLLLVLLRCRQLDYAAARVLCLSARLPISRGYWPGRPALLLDSGYLLQITPARGHVSDTADSANSLLTCCGPSVSCKRSSESRG